MYPNTIQNPIPPKLPDINAKQTLMETDSSSFKEKLMADESFQSPLPHQIPMDTNLTPDNEEIQVQDPHNNTYVVPITKEDKIRIYHPWRFSLIIKLQGKIILHNVLKKNN